MKAFPVRFATIGSSAIAKEFFACAANTDSARVRTVYSRDGEKARSIALGIGAEKYCSSLEDICSDGDIDAVYIASPNSLHAPQARMMLEAGKHVLCEKPLFANSRLVKELSSLAASKGLVLMEAYKSAYMPNMKKIYDALPSLGKIRSVFFSFGKYSSRYDAHKRGEDVNTFKKEFANGGLLDMGVYCLYPALLFFGEPESVSGTAQTVPGGVDGTGFVTLKYDGFCVCVHYSKISNSFLPCEIEGEDATMIIDRINIPESARIVYRDGKTEVLFDGSSEKSGNMCADLHSMSGMTFELEAFCGAVRASKERGCTVALPYKIKTALGLSLAGAKITDGFRARCGIVYPQDAQT